MDASPHTTAAVPALHVGRTVAVENRPSAWWVTLDRPEALNALDQEMLDGVHAALDLIAGDSRPIVFAGRGRAFSGGGDLRYFLAHLDEPAALCRYFDTAQAMLLRILDHPAATIAAVRGLAVAGGLELVCACDLAVAGTDATFADGHLVHGLLPAGASSELLRRIVGERWGRWMLLSGELVTAQMAEHIGLVNSVVADDEVEATVEQMAGTLSRRPASAVRAMKRLLRPDVEHILASERRELLAHLAHPDVRQSLQAFDRRRAATMAEPA